MNHTDKFMTVSGLIVRPGAIEKCVATAVLCIALIIGFARLATNSTFSKDRIEIMSEHTLHGVVLASK